MSEAKHIVIKETLKELNQFKKQDISNTIYKRLLMLIELKKNKDVALSKRVLAQRIGVDPNSITAWKKLYENAGMKGITDDKRIGFKPSLVSPAEHKQLEQKLNDPNNGIRGYTELLKWVKEEMSKEMNYITLLKYVERNFGTKIKVARKSHVKKDEALVEGFKKNSPRNAKK